MCFNTVCLRGFALLHGVILTRLWLVWCFGESMHVYVCLFVCVCVCVRARVRSSLVEVFGLRLYGLQVTVHISFLVNVY